MNNLKKYNQKRNFNQTKEPQGLKKTNHQKLRFVLHHHLASHDHYDLRLEMNGVLKSWAIPKGPSFKIAEKRLAVMVEDHPYSYRNFEGVIPKNNYGAGTVMIWDEGYYKCDNPLKSLKNKMLKFELFGERLKGKWLLVNTKKDNWLLIKENDKYTNYLNINDFNTSIKTARTMKEIMLNANKKPHTVETITITNGDKIIFSKPKTTKLDLVKYYQKIAKRLLPYLDKRLITTVRCPTINQTFYKKHYNDNKNMQKIIVDNEDYYYLKNITGLIKEVQNNGYEFHIWGSKMPSNKPDMMVFDLDPDEKLSLTKLREGVKDLKSILDELSLKSYLKTSGKKGYHVVVPITNISWKQMHDIAKNIALLMQNKWPNKYVSNMRLKNRHNKIFIDWVRNTKGATTVAPYSVRLGPKPTVSMPISWNELEKIKPDEITIEESLKRLKRKDPWTDFFTKF